MTMQMMFDRFKAVEDGEDVRALILDCCAGASDGGPARLVTSDVDSRTIWEHCDRRCHVCSGLIAPEDIEIECFGDDPAHSMPVHRGCHEVRAGQPPASIMFAMRFGFWVMMRIQHELNKTWREPLVEAWLADRGDRVGALVNAPNVPWWSADLSIGGSDELVRFIRHLYLYEREPPKWNIVGHEVPVWDENIAWKVYKRDVFKPAYKKWKGRSDRKTLLPAKDILARTGGVCALCGGLITEGNLGLAKDHIHPFSKGGSDGLMNLQPLHRFCNGSISSIGAGEIPLSLELGRWLIGQVSDGQGHSWATRLLKSYGSSLR